MRGFRILVCCLALVPALACQAQSAGVQQAVSITPNFKDADITQIVQAVAAATGKTFILDPRVRAQVNMFSSAPMSPPAFYQAFLAILEVYGFIAVPAGNNVVKVVPDAEMREMPGIDLPAQVSASSDEIVTQVVAIKNVSAAELVPILRPMIPQQGHLAAYPPSNILIITDHASNVHRMMAIIARIDQTGNQDVDVMPLQNASASDVVRTITTVYQGQGAIQEGRTAAKVVADDRTNSILIGGDPSQRLQIRALVAELDTPLKSGGNTRVVYLHYTDASKLAPKLKEQMSELAQMSAAGGADASAGAKNPQAEAEKNALVWADPQNNALIITAPPKVMRTILDIVQALDRRRPEVLVQAIIAELDISKTDDLGVNWAAFSKNDKVPLGGYVQPVGGTSLVDLVAAGESGASGLSDSLLAGTTIGVGTLTAGGESFAAMLRALQDDTTTNIMATPSAVTLNNQAATLKDVDEVPFVTGQYSTPTTTTTGAVTPFQTVQQEEVGIILKVTPTISAEGNAVMLKISVESSSLVGTTTTTLEEPETAKRSIDTNVLIENGGVVVLGGLIQNQQNRDNNGVPLLASIPLLGNLFKARNDSATRNDLMIFIKPTILRDQFEAADATRGDYNYMLHQQNSVIPEPFPQLLRGEPAPRLPPLPPPPAPSTLAAPNPLAPKAQPKKPEAKTIHPSGQTTPAQPAPGGAQTAPAPAPQASPSPPPASPGSGTTPNGTPP
ncbi:MAG TPA: type II secretion system secretin GspD [Steroidobacteraceae bacterium]|nr:type II secretion system secretin GspD [Steroidobacteraceae bacterium]